jgi:hypothetical protein
MNCIFKLYVGFCCLLNTCKCIREERNKTIDSLNPFKYTGL